MTRGVTLVRTVETPEFRQLVAQLYPNSIANFLFTNFPSPKPTSNIRDTGRPVAGLATDSSLNTPGVADQSELRADRAAVNYRNALQATPDGIPDIGTANVSVSEKTNGDQFSIRVDHELSRTSACLGRYLHDNRLPTTSRAIVPRRLQPAGGREGPQPHRRHT